MSIVKEPSLATVDGLDGIDAVVCLVPDDQKPLLGGAGFVDWRLSGAVSRAFTSGFFRGAPGEKLLLPAEGGLSPRLVFVLGLGASKNVTALGLEHALASAVTMLEKARVENVALSLPVLSHLEVSFVGALLDRTVVKPWKAGRLLILADASVERALATA